MRYYRVTVNKKVTDRALSLNHHCRYKRSRHVKVPLYICNSPEIFPFFQNFERSTVLFLKDGKDRERTGNKCEILSILLFAKFANFGMIGNDLC